MSTADGSWDLTVKTPVGDQPVRLNVHSDEGQLLGTATANNETNPVEGGTITGDELSWVVRASKPFPMTLQFSTTVTGETMTGKVETGMFPTAPVTGQRVG
jgi:hypothetical protein